MNCFQLVKTVLDEIYAEIQLPGEAEKDAAIKEKLNYLSDQYKKLTSGEDVDYADPITRFAYIYRYVTSHANIIHNIIQYCPELNLFFNDAEAVTMTCIGGGPGSDLLGVLKYLINSDRSPILRCTLYDREEAWGESWQDVDKKIGAALRISTYFQRFDVGVPITWRNRSKYLNSDFFTMSYFMSEVYKIKDAAMPFFENLFANAKDGSLFLYIDNNNQQFYNWFDDLAKRNSFQEIMSEITITTMNGDEQKKDLGDFYKKFKYPKLNANIAYRVCRKIKK